MTRILFAALALLVGSLGARAQPALPGLPPIMRTVPAAVPPGSAAAGPAAAPVLTQAQAQAALDVLRDDAKRAQVVSVLEALARTSPEASAGTAIVATPGGVIPAGIISGGASPGGATGLATGHLPIPLAPNSLGAQLLVWASQHLSELSASLVAAVRAVTYFPVLSRWVVHIASDPVARAALLDAAWKLAVILLAGLAAEAGVMRVLRRLTRPLEAGGPDDIIAGSAKQPAGRLRDETAASPELDQAVELDMTDHRRIRPSALDLLRRLPAALGRFALELLPILAFAGVSFALLGTGLGAPNTTRLVILAVLDAYMLCRVIASVARLMLAPEAPLLRLFHLSDAAARYFLNWIRCVAVVSIFGYALTEVGLLFGLYQMAYDGLLKIVSLVVHVFLVIIVLQTRGSVARLIRAKPEATGLVAVLRNRFAGIWHVFAIFYIVALWAVWALEVPDGFSRLLEFFVETVAIITAGRLVGVGAVGAVDRALTLGPSLSSRYPGLQARARSYHPLARATVKATMITLTLIVLFEAWGFDSLTWFASGALGGRVVSALGVIALTLLISLLVWESVNAAVRQHLDRLARENQVARSARLRTLLPMLRSTLLVGIATFAGLTILSQIGVNIAPLLAGAGVIGLAIGFGSQKLVQDIITGLFLLLENAMQVGDVVSLGGLSGTVENLSIRTIRLRALDGAVHIVPFSAVTTVTNMTKDFSYALLDVSIGLNEEPDGVIEVVRDVARIMRQEPRWESALRDDLEVMGVERFIDLAWVLRVRIKTLPGQRWAVSRELNKRLKMAFDERAIESPFTSHVALSTIPGPIAPDPVGYPSTPEPVQVHA